MAKLFKTISLEERLKGSLYNELPNAPKSVDQGSVLLKAPRATEELESIRLKLTPDSEKLNSQILKQSSASKRLPAFPVIDQFSTKPISNLARPFVNTKFRSAINLRDRLSQPELGTTSHLAQFFLADTYTDYIKITPFGIFNHTSNTVVSPVPTSLPQGGLNPVIPTFNSTTAQGITYSNGLYSSFVTVHVPTYDSLLLQGTFFSNGAYASFVQPEFSITPSNISQGGLNPVTPISLQSVAILQGLVSDQANNLTSPIQIELPAIIPITIPTSIVIVNSKPTPTQGGENPVEINFEPNRTSPILNVLGYAADRALAFFTPTIKHGSASLRGTSFATTYKPNQGQSPIKTLPNGNFYEYKSSQISPLLSNQLTDLQANDVFMVWVDWQYDYAKPNYYDNNTAAPNYIGVQYVKIGGALKINPNTTIAKALGKAGTTDGIASLITSNVSFPKSTGTEGSLASYKTLAYDQIVKRANDPSQQRPDFRKDLGIAVKDGKSVNVRGTNSSADNDFINLSISSLSGGGSVKFRAFITTFSDGFSVSWNDINYVGRQDTLKAFKGVTRAGSVGFKVAAFNKADLASVYSRLNKLVSIAAIGRSGSGGKYITGPICSITIGSWFTNTPCVFNSVKFDVQMSDYTWDIDAGVPHLIDVSADFALIGDITGKPFNASSNNYFSYVG